MRIAAMAAGAVGGYFGARLAAAGHDVHFIARGKLLEAIRARGLKVESTLGDLHLKNAQATPDPKEVGPVDIVLFAVKLWDTETAAEFARPLVAQNTRVITFQNGVDSVERIAPILGGEAAIGGSAYIASVMKEPGVVSHTSQFARMVCGRIDGRPDDKVTAFAEAAKQAGIDITVSPAMDLERWQKFTFLVGLAGATASMRQPIGAILADSVTREFFHDLMREVVAVGRAKGVPLAADFADTQFKFAQSAPATMKASLAHDLERGNRLELDWLCGKVAALGRELGVPTPANAAVYAVLKLHAMGRQAG
jgi:2-dehydropantoate 2-reductase